MYIGHRARPSWRVKLCIHNAEPPHSLQYERRRLCSQIEARSISCNVTSVRRCTASLSRGTYTLALHCSEPLTSHVTSTLAPFLPSYRFCFRSSRPKSGGAISTTLLGIYFSSKKILGFLPRKLERLLLFCV